MLIGASAGLACGNASLRSSIHRSVSLNLARRRRIGPAQVRHEPPSARCLQTDQFYDNGSRLVHLTKAGCDAVLYYQHYWNCMQNQQA
jgi:hypothetical protein